MKISAIPVNESERLKAVRSYHILDTEAEQDFDDIVELASQLCNTPISIISLVDEKRQWFKAETGMGIKETHRDLSFCAHTILGNDVMLVRDALKDERFADNPMVVGEPFIRFYGGVPLISLNGFKLGTLAVIDREPRNLTGQQLRGLRILANQVVRLLDLRWPIREFNSAVEEQASGVAAFERTGDEKKNAISVVQESEEVGKLIINSALDAIIGINGQGKVTLWNLQAERIFGWSQDEMLGRTLADTIIPERYREQHKNGLRHYHETAQGPFLNRLIEITALNRDQKEFPVELSITPINRDSDECFCAFVRDISERKKAELKLADSENHLRTIIQTEPECIKLLDADGAVLEMNPAGLAILEADSLEQVLGCRMSSVVDPKHREAFESLLKKVFEGGSGTMQLQMTSLKGTHRWMEIHAVPLRNTERKIISLLGVSRDITEWKQDQESLQRAEEQYRSIFENTREGIYQSTPDGQFITVNPSLARMFGYDSPGELINSVTDIGLNLYADPAERLRMRQHLEKKGKAVGLEFRGLKKNKEIIWVREHIRTINDSNGKIKYFEGTLEDITERKMAEAKLNEQFEELQKTNYELDRFVYSVSHDLRAPLASIQGIINVAVLEKPGIALKDCLEMIRGSVNRLDGFINDILDHSRNARTGVHSKKVDFRELIAETQNSLRLMRGAERLSTSVEIDDSVNFYSDRSRIMIILSNLVSNSINYQDLQKETSELSIRVVTSHENALITVSDNGTGIDQKQIDKIFNMFYRGSDQSKGSGLGLYIAKETTTKLGGTIDAESEFGKFTRFQIVIPNLQPLEPKGVVPT